MKVFLHKKLYNDKQVLSALEEEFGGLKNLMGPGFASCEEVEFLESETDYTPVEIEETAYEEEAINLRGQINDFLDRNFYEKCQRLFK